MAEPREIIAELEKAPSVPSGAGERFSGYGVMSSPFVSGHNLCLRRFPASSVGPAYTSVWHRDPERAWTFFQDSPPAQSCPRYFSSALARILVRDIDIEWTGPLAFSVTISGGEELKWQVTLGETPSTRLMNLVSSLVPGKLWHSPAFLKLMGGVARVTLGAGKLALAGNAPNGQSYVANPRLVWLISSSQAVLNGNDLGPLGRAVPQARLGDFWIPQRGLFAIGQAFFDLFDPSRHHTLPTEAAPGNESRV
ncbi:MAG TPA: hypothetical protein VNL15_08710 [Dehalococcoidia bacterium]|nr:hypothetical protein [Dehalococcoidia bacterium]